MDRGEKLKAPKQYPPRNQACSTTAYTLVSPSLLNEGVTGLPQRSYATRVGRHCFVVVVVVLLVEGGD